MTMLSHSLAPGYLCIMIPSIASGYTSMSQAQLKQEVNTAVLKKAMDVQEGQGAAIARLLGSAGQVAQAQQWQDPLRGQNVDLLA